MTLKEKIFSRLKRDTAPPTKTEENRMVNLRALGFGKRSPSPFTASIYEDFMQHTPQDRMWYVRQLKNTCGFISDGMKKRRNLILGGSVTIDTDDKEFKKFFEEEYFKYAKFRKVIDEIGLQWVGYGNSYVELPRGKEDQVGRLKVLPMPDQVYKDYDPKTGKLVRYVQHLPAYLTEARGLKTGTIRYSNGTPQQIQGIDLDTKNIVHFQDGFDELPEYGESSLLPSVSDGRILKEMERAMAINGRYKSVSRNYVIMKNGGQQDARNFHREMKLVDDFHDPFVTGDIDIKPMTGKTGIAVPIESLSYLEKKISNMLLPEFLSSGETVNRATAREQWKAWSQTLVRDRRGIEEGLKKILDKVWASYGYDSSPVYSIEFGDMDEMSPEAHREYTFKLWEKGGISHDEFRERLGFEPDPDLEGVYYPDWSKGGEFTDEEEQTEPPAP